MVQLWNTFFYRVIDPLFPLLELIHSYQLRNGTKCMNWKEGKSTNKQESFRSYVYDAIPEIFLLYYGATFGCCWWNISGCVLFFFPLLFQMPRQETLFFILYRFFRSYLKTFYCFICLLTAKFYLNFKSLISWRLFCYVLIEIKEMIWNLCISEQNL